MYIFVYGTLMPGFQNWHLIADKVQKISPAKIKAKLYNLPYGYPAIIDGDDDVFGYVLDLPDSQEIISVIDEFKGYYAPGKDNFYEKKNLPVTFLEESLSGEALVYLFEGYRAQELPSLGTYIPHGNWAEFISEKSIISA